MWEPGLDLHEWETRWQELQEAAGEEPNEALPEIVRFVEGMLGERGFDLDEPVTPEGENPDVVRNFLAARDLAAAADSGAAEPEDVETALENLREIYEYLVSDRAPP
jgi:hypothetical protein